MIKEMKWGGMLFASLLMASSCQNEAVVENKNAQTFTLVANKGMGSRTAIDGDKTVWSTGDRIYVSSKDGKTTGVLTLTDGAGETSGTFSGFVFGNPNNLEYSVYPAPTNGTTLDLSKIIGANQLDAPMIGKINQDDDVDVQFNHACHVLYVNLPGSTGKTFTITAKNNGTPINLAATTDITDIEWNGEVPSLDFTSNTQSITISNAKGGEMYIPFFTDAINPNQVKFSVNNIELNTEVVDLTTNNGKLGKLVKENIQVINYGNNGFEETTTVSNPESLKEALTNGETSLYLAKGTYTIPTEANNGQTLTISGTKETIIDATKGAYMDKSSLSFEGVTIKIGLGYAENGGGDYAAIYTPNATFTNCYFEGGLRVGRNGAKFDKCIFNLDANDYVYTYGNDVDFIDCTFNSKGKALIVYSDGNGDISKVNVNGCTFNASQEGFASAIKNQCCAAVEIDNYGCGVNLTLTNNTIGKNFSGEWRIKSYYTNKGNTVTVNGTEYTSLAIDGKSMTIDTNKNVTINN